MSSDRPRDAIYLNIGCGFDAPKSWTNVDASPTLRAQRIPLFGRLLVPNERRFPENVIVGDLIRNLPFGAGSIRGLYASHVLEHLPFEEAQLAMGNIRRLLAIDGVARIVLPDMESRVRCYIRSTQSGDAHASEELMDNTYLGLRNRPRGLLARAGHVFGNSRHLWMWDRASLARALDQAGFSSVRECKFGDSMDPMFREVERRDRFEWQGNPELAYEVRP